MRAYRFKFDPTSGQYAGVTREKDYIHATHEVPIFSSGNKTVWDFKGSWKLIPNEEFYSQMAEFQRLAEYDLNVTKYMVGLLEKQDKWIAGRLTDLDRSVYEKTKEVFDRITSLRDAVDLVRQQQDHTHMLVRDGVPDYAKTLAGRIQTVHKDVFNLLDQVYRMQEFQGVLMYEIKKPWYIKLKEFCARVLLRS